MAAVDQNIKLILEVEKRPCLYNYNLQDYSKKHVVDKAWADIGRELGLSGSECKEKWKNLRSVFVRQFRPIKTNGKIQHKKPYYLTEYMQFTLPFIKSAPNLNVNQDNQNGFENNVDEVEDSVLFQFEDFPKVTDTSFLDEHTQSQGIEYSQAFVPTSSGQTNHNTADDEVVQGTKRSPDNLKEEIISYLKSKRKRNDDSSNKMFLFSLLDDMNAMNDKQRRTFKRKVLELIDEILESKSNLLST